MDLLGYAALGGLERLTIVAGAVIIGYWGYRLYTTGKSAGLIFMGLAVLVLVGALATGGSYLKSVGEGYQLASLPTDTTGQNPPATTAPADATAPAVATDSEQKADAASEASDTTVPASEPDTAQTMPDAEAIASQPAPEAIAPAAAPTAAGEPAPAVAEAGTAYESPPRLATGAELGGRIVSVKSENVSLTWSDEAEQTDEPGSDSE